MGNALASVALSYILWILMLVLFFSATETDIAQALLGVTISIIGGYLTSEIMYRVHGR